MNRRETFFRAGGIAAAALGLDFASGRAMAAFYAQTGRASWLGVVFSGIFFGLVTALLCNLTRRCGAADMAMLLRRLPGGGSGRLIAGLYALVLLAAGCMIAGEAAHIGALVLPLRYAHVFGVLTAVLLSAALAMTGRRAVQRLGMAYLCCLGIYLAALLLFARLPQNSLHCGVELKLENSVPAALALALVHSAVGVCVSAGMTAAQGCAGVQPVRMGALAGVMYAAVLGLGNAVLQAKEPLVLRLKLPFSALSCAWGTPGFYIGAGMVYMGCIAGLSGLIYGSIPKRKSRILIEN